MARATVEAILRPCALSNELCGVIERFQRFSEVAEAGKVFRSDTISRLMRQFHRVVRQRQDTE